VHRRFRSSPSVSRSCSGSRSPIAGFGYTPARCSRCQWSGFSRKAQAEVGPELSKVRIPRDLGIIPKHRRYRVCLRWKKGCRDAPVTKRSRTRRAGETDGRIRTRARSPCHVGGDDGRNDAVVPLRMKRIRTGPISDRSHGAPRYAERRRNGVRRSATSEESRRRALELTFKPTRRKPGRADGGGLLRSRSLARSRSRLGCLDWAEKENEGRTR